MSFGWAEIGAGAATMGGNIWSTMQTNRANKDMARGQMEFQERMSRTAHQREVQDLIKAGLNPNLSAGGSGASTPGGASATMVAPQIDMQPVFQAMSLAQDQQKIDIAKQVAGVDVVKKGAETELTKAKERLAQKGGVRADLEGEVSQALRSILKSFRDPKKFKSNVERMKRESQSGAQMDSLKETGSILGMP